jgi:hypothetical protein
LGTALRSIYEQAGRAAAGFRIFGDGELGQLVDDACEVVARLAAGGAFDTVDLTDEQEASLEEN